MSLEADVITNIEISMLRYQLSHFSSSVHFMGDECCWSLWRLGLLSPV
jgi:hypothetical protein